MKEVKAVGKYLRISPYKVRPFVRNLRNKSVEDSLNVINFSLRKAAQVVGKVFKSAIANAEDHGDLDIEFLKVKDVFVDEGPTMRRFLPRAMGRATRIRKRSCHVTVVLCEDEKKKALAELRKKQIKAKAKKKSSSRKKAEVVSPSATEQGPVKE